VKCSCFDGYATIKVTTQARLNNTIVKIVQMGQNQDVETLRLPDVEEIDAAYEEGKAAVVALILEMASEWSSTFQRQQVVVLEQQETIAKLEERVQALEDQLAKNSQNSSKQL
jgi:hypothetical protein